jgi:uncharacterized membrane protein (TIGR02234 family)
MTRSTFGPVVLVGLGASALAAYAGQQGMLRIPSEDLERLGPFSFADPGQSELSFPLAGALALVALACWGVLLVTRGRVRQVVAAVAAVAAVGVVAVVVVGGFVQDDQAAEDIADQLGIPVLGDQLGLESTPWFWVAMTAGLVSAAAAVAAVRLAPDWPEMGSRYDAPASHDAGSADAPVEERSSLDLWKSMDEGQDPTEDTSH